MGKAMNSEDQSNLSSLRPGDQVIISDYYGIGWSRRKILSEVVRLTKTQVIVKSPHGAQNFKVQRRIVFYNSITDTYMLVIEGLCQVEHDEKLAITCKTGEGSYKKHYLGLSNNVTYFVEQLEDASVSAYHYKVTFKPQALVPDIDLRTGK